MKKLLISTLITASIICTTPIQANPDNLVNKVFNIIQHSCTNLFVGELHFVNNAFLNCETKEETVVFSSVAGWEQCILRVQHMAKYDKKHPVCVLITPNNKLLEQAKELEPYFIKQNIKLVIFNLHIEDLKSNKISV
jgi:hypothetical protein